MNLFEENWPLPNKVHIKVHHDLVYINIQLYLIVYRVNKTVGTYCKEFGAKAVLNVRLLNVLFEAYAFDASLKLPLGLIH